jgi:hypothetical protein
VRAGTSDVLLHVRLLDATNALQQEAVGRLEIDWIRASGPTWRAGVPAAVADQIDRRGYCGAACPQEP